MEGNLITIKPIYIILLISIAWVFVVLVYYTYKGKIGSRKIFLKDGKVSKTPNSLRGEIILPSRAVINVVYDSPDQVNTEVIADMYARYEDLLSGDYKVPDHLLSSKKENSIGGKAKKQQVNDDDELEDSSLIDIKKINN